jgi:hypothetical protein
MTLLPEIRAELLGAASRATCAPTRRQRLRGWPRRFGNALPLAVSIAGTIAVALIAILALHPHAGSQSPDASVPGVSDLRAQLAVLRRPQTDADRSVLTILRHAHLDSGILPAETRLAATALTGPSGRVRVFLLIRRVPSARGTKLPPVVLIAIAVDDHDRIVGRAHAFTLSDPTALGSDLRGGPRVAAVVTIGIVPDGVAAIRWVYSGAGYGILHPNRGTTVSPHVAGNVAISALNTPGPLLSAAWYRSDGHLITRHAAPAVRAQLLQIDQVNASRSRPIANVLTDNYSLFRTVPPEDLNRDPTPPPGGAGTRLGLNYWQTRYIPNVTGLDGRGLWITPGTHGLCISDPQAGTCGAISAQSASGVLGGSTAGTNQTTISGLVPDGNRTVTIERTGGAPITAPVVHNVFEATVHGRITAIINKDIHGQIHRHQT